MIERLARLIVSYGLEPIADLTLPVLSYQSNYLAHLGYFFFAPWLPLIGDAGERYFLLFKKKENVEKLRKKIKESARAKEDKGAKVS